MTRQIAVLLFLTISFCTSEAWAKPKRVLSVEVLYRFDGPRHLAVAPDGKSAIFVRQWTDANTKVERNSLWRVPRIGEKPVAVEENEPDARVPVYSPDVKWVAFLSTRLRPVGWTQTPPVPPESGTAVDIWLVPAE